MNCDGVRGLLSAYVDGELTAGELLRVEQHLRRCHWCADDVDALRQTIALVAALDEVEVPATFHAQLHQRLVALGPPLQAVGSHAAQRTRRPGFSRWAMPAAAAAALVIGVAGLNRITPPLDVTPPPAETVSAGTPSGTLTVHQPTGPVEYNPGAGSQTTPSDPEPSSDVQPPSGQGEPVANPLPENPPEQPDLTPDPALDPADVGSPAPLGPTNPGSGIHTATYMDGVTEPAKLPSMLHQRASVEATVADPEAVAANLTALSEAVSKNVSVGIVQLQITVPAAEFTQTLALVEERVDAKSQADGVELNSQLDDLYQRITSLEGDRVALVAQLAGQTDPEAREAGKLALANLDKEANLAKEAFQKLLYQIDNGVITVTLKPDTAQ